MEVEAILFDWDGTLARVTGGKTDLFPETGAVLRGLGQRGFRMAIAAEGPAGLGSLVESLSLGGLFEATLTSPDQGQPKSGGRLLRAALEVLDIPANRALYVGDDLETDVRAARAVGITPVLVDREGRHLAVDCTRIGSLGGLLTRLSTPVGEPRAVAAANLVHWLRRQLAQPLPVRERLEAAVANDDPAEVRRLLRGFPFTTAQRRYVEELLDEWERGLP